MGSRKETTGQALDLAIAGKPEPRSDWRGLIPPPDLGAMVASGSANIPLFALVAAYHYGPNPKSRETLKTYAKECAKSFMLAEPWSHIYGRSIVVAWASAVLLARRAQDQEIANLFMDLLRSFLGTAKLMASRLLVAPHGATRYEKKRVGSLVVCMPGCRSWGHPALEGGFDDLLHVALGIVEPKATGKPGDLDDWGWSDRAVVSCKMILREAGQDFRGDLTPRQIVDRTPRWAARETFELYGWEDGSRLATMGTDDPESVDEDPNSNTPGTLLCGILGGRIKVLPEWPNPATGLQRIRQQNVVADIDGDPRRGWTLAHSHLGQRRAQGGGFLSRVEPYTASKLLFAYRVPAHDTRWRDLMDAAHPEDPGAPVHNPEPRQNQETPKSGKSWIEKMGL